MEGKMGSVQTRITLLAKHVASPIFSSRHGRGFQIEVNKILGRKARSRFVAVMKAQAVESPPAAASTPTGPGPIDFGPTEDGVIVVGAGIAGLATAAALHKVGIPVIVLERESSLRQSGSAIALWPNAFRALDALGVAEPLREAHPQLDRFQIALANGEVLISFGLDEVDGGPHEFRGVYRGALLQALASAVPKNSIFFGCGLSSVTQDRNGPILELTSGQRLRARAVVGADGIRSAVRAALKLPTLNYSGYIGYRGVATFPEGLPDDAIEKGLVRQVWGAGTRVGVYPMNATDCYWFVTANKPESDPVITDPAECRADALSLSKGFAFRMDDVVNATPDAAISRSRIYDRWMAPGRPVGEGTITLAGDGFHPMTPNLGQGGCCALEDGIVLARTLKDACVRSDPRQGNGATGASLSLRAVPALELGRALREYEEERSKRVFPITVRANLMGTVLQSDFPPLLFARDKLAGKVFAPNHFLDHAAYDCGTL